MFVIFAKIAIFSSTGNSVAPFFLRIRFKSNRFLIKDLMPEPSACWTQRGRELQHGELYLS